MYNSPVESIASFNKSILVRTTTQEILADKVLLSSGGWIKDFLPQAQKARFKICRQVLHWLEIEPGENDWTKYPVWMWGFGPNPEDFIYGFPSLDGKTVKMASESFIDDDHPDRLDRTVRVEEQELFWKQKIEGKVVGLKRVFVKSVVCFYTVTEDARFVSESLPGMENVLFISACSGHGFKHSAALGERLAKSPDWIIADSLFIFSVISLLKLLLLRPDHHKFRMAKNRGTALDPEEKRKLNKQNLSKLGGIFRFLLPYKTEFIAGLVFLLFSSLTLLTFPFVAGKLIDTAQGSSWIVNDVNSIALILIGILAVQSIFSFFRVWLFALVSERSMRDIRQQLYSRLVRLPMTF